MTGEDSTADEDPVRTVTRERTVQRIGGEDRQGLVESTKTRFANTPAGWKAWADARMRVNSREGLFELIDMVEARANGVARVNEYESVLDRVATAEQFDNGESDVLGAVGACAEEGTPLAFAWQIVMGLDSLRANVADFERRYEDENVRSAFYGAIGRAIHTMLKVELLVIAENELAILRGSDSSFNHKGKSRAQQREGAKRVRKLAGPNPSRAEKAKAVQQVATEQGLDRSTVYGWLRNHPA